MGSTIQGMAFEQDTTLSARISTLQSHSAGAGLSSPQPPAQAQPRSLPLQASVPTVEDLRRIFAALHNLRGSTEWTDITVVLGNPPRAFHAHRALLASCSPQLRELLRRSPAQVHMVDISADAFATILDFLYGRPLALEMATVKPVLIAAQRLGLAHVLEHCSVFLVQNINESNWQHMHVLAAKYGLQALSTRCLEFARTQQDRNAQQLAPEFEPPEMALHSQEQNNIPRASTVVEQWARRLQMIDNSSTSGGI